MVYHLCVHLRTKEFNLICVCVHVNGLILWILLCFCFLYTMFSWEDSSMLRVDEDHPFSWLCRVLLYQVTTITICFFSLFLLGSWAISSWKILWILIYRYLSAGLPNPRPQSSTGPRPVRNQAAQQEVSNRQASEAPSVLIMLPIAHAISWTLPLVRSAAALASHRSMNPKCNALISY